ncbi:MAG: hypothetical protein KY476_13115 [Planctomycetes bacterium]|nr:hypothetical protein [Planctomycetota bacterium]
MAFPIQQDEHLSSVLRYVERNALWAGLIERAQDWRWGSLIDWLLGATASFLHPGPVPHGRDWLEWVNRPESEAELAAIRGQRRPLRPLWQRPLDEANRPASRSGIHLKPPRPPQTGAPKSRMSPFPPFRVSDVPAACHREGTFCFC